MLPGHSEEMFRRFYCSYHGSVHPVKKDFETVLFITLYTLYDHHNNDLLSNDHIYRFVGATILITISPCLMEDMNKTSSIILSPPSFSDKH